MPNPLDAIQQANAAYVEEQYARYRRDPSSVAGDWAAFFAGFDLGTGREGLERVAPQAGGVYGLVLAYREFGHLVAAINPLEESRADHPLLDLAAYGLNRGDLDAAVERHPFRGPAGRTLRDLIAALRETYCGTIGVEYMDIPETRDWLQERMESSHNRPQLSADERIHALRALLAADAFEQFLHVKYVGQKRFSLEGAASLIPMLDTLVETAAGLGVQQVVIGMPHRGRLNVLANIMHKPLETMFSEFESSFVPADVQGHGDVKYHMGYSALHTTRSGKRIDLDLNFNPSHLEFVNPVVLGSMRARQDYMRDLERAHGIPVLLHGDAGFSGQGIVPETLALAQLPAYRTGGTIHIVINNQVGFTTSPGDARVTRYVTDIAKVVKAPVFHVNETDPEAAVLAARLAVAYRDAFKSDAFIDLVCYRKHGHSELDDPTFTQPVMYRKIAELTPTSRQYAARLVAEGVLDATALQSMQAEIDEQLKAAYARTRSEAALNDDVPLGGAWNGMEWAGEDWSAPTAASRELLERVIHGAAELPAGFHSHPKVARLLQDRVKMVEENRIDWGCGEVLAFGSLLLEGFHVRLTGQDSARGTFSHRHAVLHDFENGDCHVPLQHLALEQGRFDVVDTMLSEAAVLGFEYGYSTADPGTLVLWEAQFGDFVNVAQVYVDQFLASAESKWRRMSGIVLLLPHGYEGQGPEHSSARLERFLELCANGNLQVCNLTTPAQLFHALRRQQHRRFRKPLVIMSPKSLLRHRRAVSRLADFTDGEFATVIDDAGVRDPAAVHSVLLVSGKFYYTLLEAREQRGTEDDVALVRVEQLYPFPRVELAEILRRYPGARELRWVQEEPANMGAWRNLRHRLESVLPERITLRLVGRKASPTPATGYYHMHVEQERLLLERALATAEVESLAPRAPAARERAPR